MAQQSDWARMRMSDFQTIDPMKSIAVLPTAAVEQHGPHLPVGTDLFIAEGLLEELRQQHANTDLDLRILPVQAVGKSNEHLWASGTLTLSATTALAAWTEIGLSVARAGIRKIAIVNAHGGNLDLISILARELRVQANMLALKCQWGAFGAPEGLYSAQENTHGLHGGDFETSLMLAFAPETVDMTKAQDFRSSAEQSVLQPVGPVSYGWISSDLNPQGTVGEAHLATAEKGRQTARHQAAGFLAALEKLREMPLPAR
ncbi:MAG: creatininase family protein [Roseobacter sp.]